LKPSSDFESQVNDHSEGVEISTQSLYRLDLCYQGSAYQGFQSQPNGQTVQDHIEKALATFCRHPVRITAASRTDTGVHAEHQVVTFRSLSGLDIWRLVKGLNALLPKDIRVMNAQVVSDNFHPIFNCTGKVYRYWIWRSQGESPFYSQLSWSLTGELNLDAMRRSASHVIGEHDFTSFCATDSTAKSKVRRVREIQFIERGPMIEILFLGDGFLKQMVRNLVGTFVSVGRGKIAQSDVKVILAAKDRTKAPATAPAEGLTLTRIFYGDDLSIRALLDRQRSEYNLTLYSDWL